jgi:hypothetical protein
MNSSPAWLRPESRSNPNSASSASSTAAPLTREDEKRLLESVALYLATNKFQQASAAEHARLRRDDLLKNAKSIEEKEALRILTSRSIEAEYKRLATNAAVRSTHLNQAELMFILRSADEWPFRLLTEAKRMSSGEKR